MLRVVIESPYRGNLIQRFLNRRYARKCMMDSLSRGEAPFASHLLYTQVLSDQDGDERLWGIDAGLSWQYVADKIVIYRDRGVTQGMQKAIKLAESRGMKIEYRSLSQGSS